jgi:hypothetical protein
MAQCPSGKCAINDTCQDVHSYLILTVFGMKMGWSMVIPEHGNHNPKESTDHGHNINLSGIDLRDLEDSNRPADRLGFQNRVGLWDGHKRYFGNIQIPNDKGLLRRPKN